MSSTGRFVLSAVPKALFTGFIGIVAQGETSCGTMAAQMFVLDYQEMVQPLTLREAFSEIDANTEAWVKTFVQ